jgi:hypothetical protein
MERRWARLDYPKAFRLTVGEMASRCGWRLREDGGEVRVCTIEAYEGRTPRLLEVVPIADGSSASDPSRYAPFSALQYEDPVLDRETIPDTVSALQEVSKPTDPQDPWVALRLLYLTSPDREVAGFVQQQFAGVLEADPDASLFLIRVAPELVWRQAAARSLFAMQQAPEGWVPDLDRATLFPSGLQLMKSQLLGLSSYLSPVGLARSPWISIFMAPRLGGSLAIALRRPLPGSSLKQAPELLDAFRPGGYASPSPTLRPPLYEVGQTETALRWWVQRLNSLFASTLDPGRFTSADGTYDPAPQLGVLLSLERLFDSVLGVLTHAPRDSFVRLLLLFDTLDLLDGLAFEDWDAMVMASRVSAGLAELRDTLPAGARDVLLPRCEAAVDALKGVVDDFLPSHLDADSLVIGRAKDGRRQTTSRENAAARLLRSLRNSCHSFRDHVRDPRDLSVLTAFGGEVPDAISDLALLHLLRFLAEPKLHAAPRTDWAGDRGHVAERAAHSRPAP